LKKKAGTETTTKKTGFFARFCQAQENKARISLIVAACVVLATVGTVCIAAINSNISTPAPSENMELNIAEQYLAQARMSASMTEATFPSDPAGQPTPAGTGNVTVKNVKRGSLTGEHVVDLSDLKSLTDEELVDAIVSGKAGVIDRSEITTDQSANVEVVHQGSTASAPTATPTPEAVEGTVTIVDYELGIDISEFQGNINWSKVKEDGIDFAFIRIGGRFWGSGGLYEDNKFSQNIQNARANGIKVGVYFFSQAITPYEALEEASLTLSKLGGMGLDLPVVMDWETGGGYRTEDLYGQDFANVITAFCSTIAQNGYTPCVYLNTSDINNRLGSYSGEILSKYKLWYAYPYSCYSDGSFYQAGDTIPPRSFYYEYWQYSWRGDVSGISTDVDLNIRILGKTTLYAPEINVTNTSIKTGKGQEIDPLDGVSATTSKDDTVTSGISYEITNESNQEVSLETAMNTVGTYRITYAYTDSYRGRVIAAATWEVVDEMTVTPTPAETNPSDQTDPTGDATDPTGDATDPTGEPTEGSDPTGENTDPTTGDTGSEDGDTSEPADGGATA